MKKTNFDGLKKTASKNLASEINWAENKLSKKEYIKYFIVGFFIGLGILIIINEMLGNPVYQYFLNKQYETK